MLFVRENCLVDLNIALCLPNAGKFLKNREQGDACESLQGEKLSVTLIKLSEALLFSCFGVICV